MAAFQVPITFGPTAITTAERVARAHSEGYAWQNWFSGDDSDSADSWRTLIDMCVDGTMTAQPACVRARAALAPAAGELHSALAEAAGSAGCAPTASASRLRLAP